jgi:DNA-binding MarR family transcriptional regulator
MSEQKDSITKAEYEMLAAFRYELRRFLHFSEAAAEKAGLTPQQHQALLAIKGFPQRERITISELAEQLQIRHHSAVGLVNRLVAQGLVTRETGPDDRRQVFISLTDSGADLLQTLSAAHREELKRVGPTLRQLLETLSPKQS